MSDSQADELLKVSSTLGEGKLVLRELDGEEGLSVPFHYRLLLTSTDAGVDYPSLINTVLTVTVQNASAARRYISGIVTRVRLLRVQPLTRAADLEVELRPTFWLLGLAADSCIFQNKSVPDILDAVLSAAGITAVEKSLGATYASREYCVQYRESNLDFLLRLMEDEGIFFFFKHAADGHTLVLADSADAHADMPNTPTLRYRPNLSRNLDDEDVISEVSSEQRIVSSAYGVDSYNFETPSTKLFSTSSGSGTMLQVNDFPGWHATTSDGETLAKRRLESLESDAKLLHGGGLLPSLVAGYRFTLAEHARAALNGAYVVRTLRLRASPQEYRADFVAFPAATPFRPPRVTPRPVIASTQTAMVAGKAGEDQWVDKYGRIKVQFHWDRAGTGDENASCWVRVAQGMAGKSWGMMFLPRIGQEVVISFLEGDPDRPLVTGAVYNATSMPPYTLPDEQTKSVMKTLSTKNGTGKSNELRFEDKLDSEEIYINAQKDLTVNVLHDETRTVQHDSSVTVTNDATLTINHDNTVTVKNNCSRTISEGNDTLTISQGTRSVSVKGNETHANSADFTQSVNGAYKLTVTGDLTIEVSGALSIKAASITMQSSSGAVGLKAATGVTAEAGTALELKSGTGMKLASSLGLDLKATTALTAEGLSCAVKGSTTTEVNGGAMLKLVGALVKVD